MVKNWPANAGDARDMGFKPGSGRPPGVGNSNQSSILGWKIPWLGRLVTESDTTEGLSVSMSLS